MARDERDDDERRWEGGFGFFGSIDEFFQRFEELQRRLDERDDVDVDTSFSYRVGNMGPNAPGRKGHPQFGRRPTQGDPTPTVDADDFAAERPDVVRRVTGGPDGPVLTADLSGTGIDSVDDLDVNVSGGAVVVSRLRDGASLLTERVADATGVASTRLNNGVLEVSLRS